MREAVFVLCAVTSVGCAGLLLRAWLDTRSRLILGALLCFVGLAATNSLLAVDVLALPGERLPWRGIPAAAGLAALAFVMITTEPS